MVLLCGLERHLDCCFWVRAGAARSRALLPIQRSLSPSYLRQ